MSKTITLNPYRIMWLFVFFDLPVLSKPERKAAAKFRKILLKDGFRMMQYSVYTRYCMSPEKADVHQKRIEQLVPGAGHVSILRVTDKQYAKIVNFWKAKPEPMEAPPRQLEIF